MTPGSMTPAEQADRDALAAALAGATVGGVPLPTDLDGAIDAAEAWLLGQLASLAMWDGGPATLPPLREPGSA